MESIPLAGGASLSSPGLRLAAFTVWVGRQSNDLLALGALGQTLAREKGAEKSRFKQSQCVPLESTRISKNESKTKPLAPHWPISEHTIDYPTSQIGGGERKPNRFLNIMSQPLLDEMRHLLKMARRMSTLKEGWSRVPVTLRGRTVPAPCFSKSGSTALSRKDLIPVVVWETLACKRSAP